MYEYNICTEADEEIFKKQCAALEKHIPGLVKGMFLHDVDDSKIQEYKLDGKTIDVYNDKDIGAVYIKSEIELTQFFKKK